jgi:hypothetical protein
MFFPSNIQENTVLKHTVVSGKTGQSLAPVAHAVILAIWEAEIRRIEVQNQLRQIVHKIPFLK